MIGHGQYGELQFGNRSLTWVSSGDKTSTSISPSSSSTTSTATEDISPTPYSLATLATTDIGDAIDISESVNKQYSPTLTTDTGSATDTSTSVALVFSPSETIDNPWGIDAVSTSYVLSPVKSSELATAIQKAIGSEQYGAFQWGNISSGLPTDRALPTGYVFNSLQTSDVGDSAINTITVDLHLDIPQVTDISSTTEKPESIPWSYAPDTGAELIVDVVSGIKPDMVEEPRIAGLYASTTSLVQSAELNYDPVLGNDTAKGIDAVEVIDLTYTPIVQGETASSTLTGTPEVYNLVPISATGLSVATSSASSTSFALIPLSATHISSSTESPEPVAYDIDTVQASEWITVILNGSSTDYIYQTEQTSDIGTGVDTASSTPLNIVPVATVDVGNATDIGSSTALTIVPVTTTDDGWSLEVASATEYQLSTELADVISSVTEQVETTEMVYEPILVVSEGVVVDTLIITHDYDSHIIHS